ncbi:hypothetical protein [Desulfofustis phage LS06-2018-MD01]|nr:hypothetical protein [Desulfofustis phage LS06-2018-MD01]
MSRIAYHPNGVNNSITHILIPFDINCKRKNNISFP